jgi:hypothetical protein
MTFNWCDTGAYVPTQVPHLLWVTEFPLFTSADGDKDFLAKGRLSSSHHPFTAPMAEDVDKLLNGQAREVRGQHYDLVLNGIEIGGGSVRVHDPALQRFIFEQVLQVCLCLMAGGVAKLITFYSSRRLKPRLFRTYSLHFPQEPLRTVGLRSGSIG